MDVGSTLPLWSIIPFVGMLLSIAIFPLVKGEWWEKHELHVAIFWSLIFCIPFGIAYGGHQLVYNLLETVVGDYIPFIVLLLGLFTVAGGIAIKGELAGTTKNNVLLLLVGTLLASWVGTTGAAMLMIRPVLRANQWRKRQSHIVVFFIFLVANMGGCLTPLGDPPLFLGYLRGVPFFWTIEHILPLLLLNTAILLVIFALLDRRNMKKDLADGCTPPTYEGKDGQREKLHIEGAHNLIFLVMIIIGVILNGTLNELGQTVGFYLFDDIHLGINYFVQIGIILLAMFLSLKTTPYKVREVDKETIVEGEEQERKQIAITPREYNEFSWAPITEVAKLFIGIFITMIPALLLLSANGSELGIDTPLEFFWATGALSSFLDNSPTYVVFLTCAGSLGATEGVVTTVGTVAVPELLAISAGAVFMGANTYIGNAPNFMVKNIAEAKHIKMPSFFGYMGWSCIFLIPVFIIDSLIFFI